MEVVPECAGEDAGGIGEEDAFWLRRAFRAAVDARARGDRPFGAVVVDAEGEVLADAGSTHGASGDGVLARAEMNALAQVIAARVPAARLRAATIYCSAEPCALGAAAIALAGVGRVVFGLDSSALPEGSSALPGGEGAPATPRSLGPCLPAEAAEALRGYRHG